MKFSKSDHFNGQRFFNPEPQRYPAATRQAGLVRLLRARLTRDQSVWSKWPVFIENRSYPVPDGKTPSLTWIGHSSFLICLGGVNILTDPVFSQRCSPVEFAGPKRVRKPGLCIEVLPRIDLILLSHNHYDHMDVSALRKICEHYPEAQIVTGLGNQSYLGRKGFQRVAELDWWQHVKIHHMDITATPARHFSARTLFDRNRTLWTGFILKYKGYCVYFAGDTGYTKYFSEIHDRLGAPHLALLPIGAYKPRDLMATVHMNPDEAVQAFKDLKAHRAVGMHFGTFQLTGEAIEEPPQKLSLACAQQQIPPDKFFVLDVGETTKL